MTSFRSATLTGALLAMLGCSSPRTPREVQQQLLRAVGERPRVYAILDGEQLRVMLWDLAARRLPTSGKAMSDCGIQSHALRQVRIAIGEPFRMRLEIDGAIDSAAFECFVGDPVIDWMLSHRVTVRDRPGGISIERDLEKEAGALASPMAVELATLCAPSPTMAFCVGANVGPVQRRILVGSRLDSNVTRLRVEGHGFVGGASELVRAFRLVDALPREIKVHAANDQFELVAPFEYAEYAITALAQFLRPIRQTDDAMVPTIKPGDIVVAASVDFAGAPEPGDVIVFKTAAGLTIARFIARSGQTVTETPDGILVDGARIPSELMAAHVDTQTAAFFREHVGGRSYRTSRTSAGGTGSWTVPAGHVFVLGDNRETASDSRTIGPVALEAIKGRVIGILFALDDQLPAWDRFGALHE